MDVIEFSLLLAIVVSSVLLVWSFTDEWKKRLEEE